MFQWKEEYRIDGDKIDQEHQHLLELADKAVGIVDPTEEAEEVKEAIREVYRYMEYHFANEQKLMSEAEFPEYEDHVEKHKKIIHEMNAILKNCHDIKVLAAELRQLMVKWVVEHIMEEDKKFSAHIKSQIGVS